jgi:lipoprotein Spr
LRQLLFLMLLIFVVSCKSTSGIITSKDEAQKMGLYKAPENKKVAVRATSVPGKVSARATESRKVQSKRRVIDRNEDDYIVSNDESSYMVKQLVNAASENLGVGYHGGGITPDEGFDCSGLMYSTFKKFDITLPRSSNDMAKIGRKLRDSDIKVGDLIFFRTNGKRVINHVGMVTEINPDEIKFIHSSTQKGVIISSTKEPYYERTFAQANRILE